MNEPKERQSANAETKTTGDMKRAERARRIAIYAGVLLAAFLLGLVPMWLTARERAKELGAAQTVLRVSRLQNRLANAAVDARRGNRRASFSRICARKSSAGKIRLSPPRSRKICVRCSRVVTTRLLYWRAATRLPVNDSPNYTPLSGKLSAIISPRHQRRKKIYA